ncbi:MAG TPA: translation elongation factor Ts [Alphaproteobacteria bacterium]|nr:elongation factor Ts [Rhodospirillaceae bacterium]HRJ67366.1 translation elongation factor Ts [Alphaproteobacteria bacterium]
MTEVTASMVKELREKSGAGMLDCKKALAENNGDIDAAMDFLRKKGLASAAKKSSRAAAEGLVSVAANGNTGVIIELNAETDFVARNDQFQTFLSQLTDAALSTKTGDVEALKKLQVAGKAAEEGLTELIANIGENMTLRRSRMLSVPNGVVATYVHNALQPNRGKIGVLVALESTGDADKLGALGRQLAMHIAAARPEALTVEELNPETVARERAVHADKATQSGKPADIVEKMVEGSMRKYYEQVVLMNQTYIIDGENKISAVIEKAAKDIGAPVKLAQYVRFELGEGVEKAADDFASEVAKMANG